MAAINTYDLNYTDAFKLGIKTMLTSTVVLAVVNIGALLQALQ